MIGIDTNVLVRYIVQDDVKQSKKATDFIEQCCSMASPGFISSLVLCELVWVLETAYEYSKQEIGTVLETILRIRQFQIEEPEIMWRSLQGYVQHTADFADHYIVLTHASNECKYTITFDKKAARLKNTKLLE